MTEGVFDCFLVDIVPPPRAGYGLGIAAGLVLAVGGMADRSDHKICPRSNAS
ncbi:MAG: hypothetical protein ACXW27_07855 [Allosphingosinicella sp.]